MVQCQPAYTAENTSFAYQFNWSLTLFWKEPPASTDWLDALGKATEADGVRVLSHRFSTNKSSQFLISTRPDVAPCQIPWSVKGRLQYLIRGELPCAFQRNYDLRSVGSTSRVKVEAYIASQIRHHEISDVCLQDVFNDLQLIESDVNLALPRFSAHGRFWCNLHIVFVQDWREAETSPSVWLRTRDMIRRSATKQNHQISRIGIVPDHLHFSVGTSLDRAPQDIALSYMNNIAYVHGMKQVLTRGGYLGTFGEYDLGAIQDGDEVVGH